MLPRGADRGTGLLRVGGRRTNWDAATLGEEIEWCVLREVLI